MRTNTLAPECRDEIACAFDRFAERFVPCRPDERQHAAREARATSAIPSCPGPIQPPTAAHSFKSPMPIPRSQQSTP